MRSHVIGIGDLHLQATNPRNEDRLHAFDQAIGYGCDVALRPDENLAAWLVLGDVFHTRSTPDDRNAVATRLVHMANQAPVLIIPGNHEAPQDLLVFGKLKAVYPVAVVDTPRPVFLEGPAGQLLQVFCLPYPTKAGLVSAGVAPADIQDAASAALEAVFIMAADAFARERDLDRGTLQLMIGHATIASSMSSCGQPMGQHGEIVVTANHLDRLGAVPKLFGHIHKPQEVFGAVYAGSMCRMDYGETEEKRFLDVVFLDPVEAGAVVGPAWRIDSLPIDCPPRYHVEGLLTRERFTWNVTKGPGGPVDVAPSTWRGCEVRVRYKFAQSDRSVLDVARVYAEFAEASRLEVEPVVVVDRALRSPAVAAARTLPDKVAAYLDAPALPDGMAAKLAALDTRDRVDVLADVAAAATAAADWGTR